MCKWSWAVSFFCLVPQMSFVLCLNSVLFPCQVVCSCCLQPPPTQSRGFSCSQSHRASWDQPIWRHCLSSFSLTGGRISRAWSWGQDTGMSDVSAHTEAPTWKTQAFCCWSDSFQSCLLPCQLWAKWTRQKGWTSQNNTRRINQEERQRWQHLSFWSQKKN